MRLENKVAIVTGSSRGIGRAIALRFADEGANLLIVYVNNQEAAVKVQAAVAAKGRRAVVVQGDVAKPADCQRIMDAAIEAFGTVDILVNNAGTEKAAPFWQVTEADYDRVMAVNLKSSFFLTQAFVRFGMQQHGWNPATTPGDHVPGATGVGPAGNGVAVIGKIINISSVHEDLPFPNFAAYCASKGGMRMLTRTLAVELGPLGFTVNGIAPGAIKTEINANLLANPEKTAALLGKIPLARMGEGAEVGGLAAFLASADADYVTGSTYFIDGGLSVDYHEQ